MVKSVARTEEQAFALVATLAVAGVLAAGVVLLLILAVVMLFVVF